MLPWIEISQKVVFTCELTLPGSINVENLKKWLSAGKATEVSFSEVIENSEKYWTVRFCSEDAILIAKLNARCKELALDVLKQRDERRISLAQKLKTLEKKLQASQNAEASRMEYVDSLKKEIQHMRYDISNLRDIESQYKSLSKAYKIQGEKVSSLEKKSGSKESGQSTSESEQIESVVRGSAPHISLDECIVCGKTAMPAQGICLDCSR